MISPKEEAILKNIGEYSIIRQEVLVMAYEALYKSVDVLLAAMDHASARHVNLMQVVNEFLHGAEEYAEQVEKLRSFRYHASMN